MIIHRQGGNITFVGYFNYNPIGIKRLIGDTPLAIDEQVSFDFNVYPNPSQGVFTIDTPVNDALDILNA